MNLDAGDAEARHAALARAEHVAFAAQLQIFLGDAEAVVGLAQDGEPRLGGRAERRLVEQEAGRALGAAADAAAQLMQLREPEALGVLDHHHARLRHVDADLDHRGGDQKPRLARGEARHGAILVGPAHAAVDEIDRVAEALLQSRVAFLGGGEIDAFGFLDQRADPIDAAAVVERARHRLDHFGEPVERHGAGIDLLPARPAFRAIPKCPCRRNRSAPACAGSASR